MAIRYRQPPGLDRYMTGLRNATAKGTAAAEDPAFTEAHNPYRMYEHRMCWRDAFRARRAAIQEGQA